MLKGSFFLSKSQNNMSLQIMGVLNITPDSFYVNSRVQGIDEALRRVESFCKQGIDILDIGGESTRPQSIPVPLEEEKERVIPIVEAIRKSFPKLFLSIDTYKPELAAMAIDKGVDMINDVQGGRSPKMRALIAQSGIKYCLMHMECDAQTMQVSSHQGNIIDYLVHWFDKKTNQCTKDGIQDHQIILDPGIGFGKSIQDNIGIIKHLKQFKQRGYTVLIGLSRKSFLHKILDATVDTVLPATLAMGAMSLFNGADILRVHDIEEHVQIKKVIEYFYRVE